MASYVVPNFYIPFSINGAATDMQVTHAMVTNPPHTTRDAVSELCAGNNLGGPFPLKIKGHYVHEFLNVDTSDQRTLLQLLSVHLR